MSDLENYIDTILETSQDTKQLKKVALKINTLGGKIADFIADTTPKLKRINSKLTFVEEEFDDLVEELAGLPQTSLNLSSLNIFKDEFIPTPSSNTVNTKHIQQTVATPQMQVSQPSIPTSTNLGSSAAVSNPVSPGASSGAPVNSPIAPNLASSPPSNPVSPPNLSGGAPISGSNTPNLGGGTPSSSPGAPNLGGVAPNASPAMPNLSGSPNNNELQSALGALKSVPQDEMNKSTEGAPSASVNSGGITQDSIQSALKGLQSVPEDEIKKPSPISSGGGGITQDSIQSALKGLKSVKTKGKEANKQEAKEEINLEEMSAEDMKKALQDKLKSAFKGSGT